MSERRGLTLLELIVVIAIMGVLVGIAVPYYQDSVADARRNSMKSNLSTLRQVINQFRGDQGRGPLRVNSVAHAADGLAATVTPTSDAASELVAGPVQFLANKWQRRNNVRYLPKLPMIEDPYDGGQKPFSVATDAATFYVDANGNDVWNIDSELAWRPLNAIAANASATPTFQPGTDTALVQPSVGVTNPAHWFGSASKKLDFIDVYFVSGDGTIY